MKKLLLLLIVPFLSFGQMVATEDCNSMPDPGMCLAYIQTFYFNQATSQCEESYWGGCDGVVPFWTLEECQNSCENNIIEGCVDETACNYNPDAKTNNNSCLFPGDECVGFDVNIGELVYGILGDNCECGLPLSIDRFLETKKIIKVFDVLGRDYGDQGFTIEIYDDGSVEKKYLIK